MSRVNDFVDSLDLQVGQSYRGDCPLCNGKNTFTVSNDVGSILYNCYKNSCHISGVVHRNMDASTIKELMARRNSPESDSEWELREFTLPPYLTPYLEVEHPIDPTFLDRYDIDPDDVMYDIRQDRLVFPVISERGITVDAVGRSLTGRQPKWLRYASSPVPYVHGLTSNYAVIVEDAISAYVVGQRFTDICTGVALLGTQLTDYHKYYIKQFYGNVIVALDPDARDKTVRIARELGGMALNLEDDLKYANRKDLDNLAEMLYE